MKIAQLGKVKKDLRDRDRIALYVWKMHNKGITYRWISEWLGWTPEKAQRVGSHGSQVEIFEEMGHWKNQSHWKGAPA